MAATDLTEAVERDIAPERGPRPKPRRRVVVLRYARWLVLLALAALLQMTNVSGATLKLPMAAFAVGVIGWLIFEDVP